MLRSTSDKVVILGCGCFGASTAYHLLQRGYTDVTILEKSPVIPAPDAASNDINRIVRSSYADRFYGELGREAIEMWKKEDWNDTYHESGVVVLGCLPSPSSDSRLKGEGSDSFSDGSAATPQPNLSETPYAEAAFLHDLELGARVNLLRSSEAIFSVFPPNVEVGAFRHSRFGYLNCDGGWADAGQGLTLLAERVRKLGGKVQTSKEVKHITVEHGRSRGVVCSDGSQYEADIVVIATGSWSASLLPTWNLQDVFIATGQCVAMVQLTAEEGARYKDCPVILDFDTGFYIFPPNKDNTLKMAIHAPGYTNTIQSISTPRTVVTNPTEGLSIPIKDVLRLKEGLNSIYPEFKDREFSATRLCCRSRYNDSGDGEWVISRYPSVEGVVFATAGSGHAYKFLPVIGRFVADLLEDKLTEEIVNRFSYSRTVIQRDTSRLGEAEELDLSTLWTPPQRTEHGTSE